MSYNKEYLTKMGSQYYWTTNEGSALVLQLYGPLHKVIERLKEFEEMFSSSILVVDHHIPQNRNEIDCYILARFIKE